MQFEKMKQIDFQKFTRMDVLEKLKALAEIVGGTAFFAASNDEAAIRDFLKGFEK